MQLVSEVIAPFVQMNPQEIQNKAQSYTTYAQIRSASMTGWSNRCWMQSKSTPSEDR
jgi:hypothetical protein